MKLPLSVLSNDLDLTCPLSPESPVAIASRPVLPKNDERLRVRVSPQRGDGAIYREGERAAMRLECCRDCHIRVYYTDAAGKSWLIFPNNRARSDRLVGKQALWLGGPDHAFNLEFQRPLGVESFKVLAARLPLADDEELQSSLDRLPASGDAIKLPVPDLERVLDVLVRRGDGEMAEAFARVVVRER